MATRATRTGLGVAGARSQPRDPLATRILGILLSICVAPAAAQVAFERYEVVTGTAPRQTVLTGFFLGRSVAELAVVTIDERGDRRLRMYAFGEDAWTATLDATLGPEVSFVDVANIGGRDRFITYEPGRLSAFDPETAAQTPLVAVTSSFDPPRPGAMPHADVTRDVNGDGRDDLVVPGVDGFRVFVQTFDGSFAEPVTLGPRAEMGGIYGAGGYRYDPWSQSRIHAIDHNGDGRDDLAFWNNDHFVVHHQDASGLFSPRAETFTIGAAFDSDDPYRLATADLQGRVLDALADLNGDGVADLVLLSLQGASLAAKRSALEVHFGMRAPDGGVAFGRASDTAIRTDRVQLAADRHDFDGDGQIDVMRTTIGTEFLRGTAYRRFRGFMGGEIHLSLEFFAMAGGRYPAAPDATRRINLQHPAAHRGPGWVPLDLALRGGTHERRLSETTHPRAFNTIGLLGDVTGDKRLDLLIGRDRGEPPGPRRHADDSLHVFAGEPGPHLFSPQPWELAVALPEDGEFVWLEDLDDDGRQDVVMHHPSAPEPHRVTVLMAR